jgi:ribosome recycling factor
MDEYWNEMREEMDKPLKHLKSDLAKVRTGRASLALLDDVRVDYYGSPTPLNGVASLSVPEPRQIIVKPWDTSILGQIEKAITAAQIGVTPNSDGKIIRLNFPELTGERRKDLCKQVERMGEETKVAVRGVRREYNELWKGMAKDGDISEDDSKRAQERVQTETDAYCAKVDEIVKNKEKEITSI